MGGSSNEVRMLEAQQTPGFDPFLNEVRGAETHTHEAGINRGVGALTGRQVIVATHDRGIALAHLETGLVLRFAEPHGLATGMEVAISDHRGFRYVGVRTRVAAAVEPDSTWARLEYPEAAVFYPGRRHVRIPPERLGARVELKLRDGTVQEVRAIDVSAGGLCLVLPTEDGFVVGQAFGVTVRFEDETLELPARVRSAMVEVDEVRLGVEFAGAADELSRRINRVMRVVDAP
jgi:hypothetical protein